ncbi:MAG: hypothetical protein OES32_18755 [Acidobacteriota bacterium]|nr:hypothetical protein [Acidobacteriota bacterium]MDH3525616.1 hypothetical protein [Acidobacteriota bacterium]
MLDCALALYLITLAQPYLEAGQPALRHAAARANESSYGRQEQVALAAAGTSSFVVWSSARQEAGSSGVYGRVFDPLARPLTPEVHLNETLIGRQDRPAVAARPDGDGAWAVWQSSGPGGTRVVARGFDASLRPTGSEIWLEDPVEGVASSPVVDVSAGGRVFTAWVAHPRADRPGGQVRGRLLDPSGEPLGAVLRLSSGEADALPTVVSVPGERFLVAWAGREPQGPAGLRARFVSEATGQASETMRLVEAIDGDCPPIEPSLDASADGSFVVAWMQCEPGGYGVWLRRFDARGMAAGPPFRVAGADSGWKSGAAVTVAPDGRTALSYNNDDGSGQDLWVRTFTAAGTPLGGPRQVTPATPGRHLTPVASGARRSFWTRDGQLAWAWQGTSSEDSYGVHLTSWTPAGLELPRPPDPAPERRAEPVASAALAPIPPIWNPDFEPQQRLADPQHGVDFGFEPILQTPWTPPDPELAVGPSMLMFMANGRIASYTRSGALLWQDEIENTFGFWGELGADNLVFDPEVTWDEHSQRFFAMANEDADDGTPYFLLAVSADGFPDDRDDWHKYRWDVSGMAGGSLFIDSPNLAVNRDYVFLTADFFGPDKYLLFVVDKPSILSGGTALIADDLIVGSQSMGIPNVRSDTAVLYIVESTELGTNDSVILHAVTDPFGSFTRESFALSVPTYTFPPADPPQSGTSSRPELFESRFWSVTERNGSIWAVHHVDSARARVRWYEIALNGWPSGSDPSLAQTGEIDLGPDVSTFFPSIDVDDQDTAAITFSRSSATEFISIWRTVRTAADPPGTFQPAVEVQVSANPSTTGRWGDYSGTEADPVVDGSFWGVHEFTNGTTSSWRTWAARYDVGGGLIFADGFESGDTSAWSTSVP